MTKKGKSGKILGGFFDRYDHFSTPVRPFNFEGELVVGSSVGFIFSIIMLIIMLAYSISKGRIMF